MGDAFLNLIIRKILRLEIPIDGFKSVHINLTTPPNRGTEYI